MKVIVVRPYRQPTVENIGETLEDLQRIVGGYIQEVMPWDDEVALVCNEEGKLMGLPLNRPLCDEDGQIVDYIAGTFFLAYAPWESESYLSMPEDLTEKYVRLFTL